MDTSEIALSSEYFHDLKDHISHNYQIADFYENLYNETDDYVYFNKSKSVDTCCKYWDMDYYRFQSVKDIKRVNLCKDKFCFNCQSMLALKRFARYAPILDKLKNQYKIYHVVFTVPNCRGEDLKSVLYTMYKKFPYLIRYLDGRKRIRKLSFDCFGFQGCVRALEVTRNSDDGSFHPHFHCMFVMSSDIKSGSNLNVFSYDDGIFKRSFSDFEIVLQKIWFLLLNDEKVTKSSVESFACGYSVMAEPAEGHYHEVFKYAVKGAFDEKKGAFIYDEHVFRFLYFAFHNRRMIQGYGILHNFTDLDTEIIEEEVQEAYLSYIAELQQLEKPEFHVESLEDILERSRTCKYISKNNLKRLLIERKKEESGL